MLYAGSIAILLVLSNLRLSEQILPQDPVVDRSITR